jgi:hypothetical protein
MTIEPSLKINGQADISADKSIEFVDHMMDLCSIKRQWPANRVAL